MAAQGQGIRGCGGNEFEQGNDFQACARRKY